jgi:hypothetical protein
VLKASNDFRAVAGGIQAKIMLFYDNSER